VQLVEVGDVELGTGEADGLDAARGAGLEHVHAELAGGARDEEEGTAHVRILTRAGMSAGMTAAAAKKPASSARPLDIDAPARVVATTPTGEVSPDEAPTIALFGFVEAANARDTALLEVGPTGRVHVDVYPVQGEALGSVVFVGGLSNHALGSASFEHALSRRGWNVVGVDLRGHGRSSGRRGDFTIPMVLEDLAAAGAYAKERFGGKVAVMGSSLGGFYALCAANAIDGFECAVSHWIYLPNEPITKQDARMRPVALLLDKLVPGLRLPTKQVADWDGVCEDPELRQKCFDDPLMAWRYSARALASGFRYDPERALTDLRVPHLVLIGEQDTMTPLPYTKKVYDQLRGDKEWVTIPGAGHMGGLVEHQDEVLDAVHEFLSRRMG
jgi:pimeloyl-ACP methyl ester carboxylesterase